MSVATVSKPNKYAQVMSSGLWTSEDESHFSWSGCDVCENEQGSTVYTINGYISPGSRKSYTFDCCENCLMKYSG